MKIAVLTPDMGNFVSNELKEVSQEDALAMATHAARGDLQYMQFARGDEKVFIPASVLARSIITVTVDQESA